MRRTDGLAPGLMSLPLMSMPHCLEVLRKRRLSFVTSTMPRAGWTLRMATGVPGTPDSFSLTAANAR